MTQQQHFHKIAGLCRKEHSPSFKILQTPVTIDSKVNAAATIVRKLWRTLAGILDLNPIKLSF